MSVARYSREIHLEDLNNVHTLALLAVPAGSRVLDLGAAEGTVARALAARGCEVTAVEGDAEGVAALRSHGLQAVHADLDTLPAEALPPQAFDVVLLLDVLEHLVHPQRLLAMVAGWLAPGGRVLVAVPNVAHAAVRLALLQGTFPRGDTGLLDRTHLHFFDRAQLDTLIADAGLSALAVLTVERDVRDTELAIDVDSLPGDVLALAQADPSSRIYQYFVVAAPASVPMVDGALAQALQERLQATERSYRQLETYASKVDAELLLMREARDHLEGEVGRLETERLAQDAELRTVTEAYRQLEAHAARLEAEARTRSEAERRREAQVNAAEAAHRALESQAEHLADALTAAQEGLRHAEARADEAVAAREANETDGQYLADAVADRDTLRAQLRSRMEELHASAATHAALQRELAVQREFAASLAAQVPRIAALGGEALVLAELERFRAVAGTPEAASAVASEAAELRRLQDALAIRALARLDAWLRRRPRLRLAVRGLARRLAGRGASRA